MTNIEKAQQLATELRTVLHKAMVDGGSVQSMIVEGLLRQAQELESHLARLQHSIEMDAGSQE